jgi:PBSX family phage terminase large subunit
VTTFELHEFQEKAFTSDKRIIAMAAGIQSGKTLTGALWAGDRAAALPFGYNGIICAPTYKILAQATLPAFLSTYGKYGKFQKIWLDEGGLISKYAWDNVLGRAAFMQAQVMITTTPYSLNWLFLLWQDWKDGKRDDVDFIQFTSRQNPHFPEEEYLRQKRLLDTRRFNMKFMGQFGRMEGLVYENVAYLHSFPMPEGTKYYAGVDWGYTNPFVLTIRAITPEGLHYRVAEFYKSGLMIEEIAQICKARKQLYNIIAFVCDPSAPAYIEGLNRAGCPAIKGNNDVRKGIDTHASIIKQNRFFIFEAENPQGKDEYSTYHYPEQRDYKIDEDQKEQEPVKASDHGCDADRYVTMHLESMAPKKQHKEHSATIPADQLKRLEWLKKGGSSRFNR